jgi:hypothetical protein
MQCKLTQDQRIYIFKTGLNMIKYATVTEMFLNEFPDVQPPICKTIYKLNKRYEKTGSISDLPQIRTTKTAATDENLKTVTKLLVASPIKLTKTATTESGIARISSQQIVNRLTLRPHRPKLLHVLHEDDSDGHIEFCKWYLT